MEDADQLGGCITDHNRCVRGRRDPSLVLACQREFDQEANASAKHALDHKPKPKFYLEDPVTGEIITGRSWVIDSVAGSHLWYLKSQPFPTPPSP